MIKEYVIEMVARKFGYFLIRADKCLNIRLARLQWFVLQKVIFLILEYKSSNKESANHRKVEKTFYISSTIYIECR